MNVYRPATRPTLYFIGVSTARSSIMHVFPAWAKFLGLDDAVIKGIDFPAGVRPAAYREAVEFIKRDPLSRGALVTTHKLDLFSACHDLFDELDEFSSLMGEVSCLSKRAHGLVCHAKDPISSGLTLESFLPEQHFATTGAEVFCMGAGGSTLALSWYLMQRARGLDVPARIVVSDTSPERLGAAKKLHHRVDSLAALEYVLVRSKADNDSVVGSLKPGSLVVNATGLGKDAPGSPVSDACPMPERGIVWDLNYRGNLLFLEQARSQARERVLQIEDGWTYFIHGWTQVIAEVFDVSIDASGAQLDMLSEIAAWKAERGALPSAASA